MPTTKMASCGNTTSGSDNISSKSSYSPSQRPSYFDFSSTAGLYPPQHTFDEAVIKKLDPELFDESAFSESGANVTGGDEKLKTFLRIRPILHDVSEYGSAVEVKDSQTVVAYGNRKNLYQDGAKKQTEFKFSKVLGPTCGQSTVFEECVTPIIDKFMRHENCLIFSYGATNSGKTYTMQGHGTEYGIIPRTLDAIFSRIHDRQYRTANIRPQFYQSFHHLSAHDVEALHEKRNKIITDANIKQELMSSYRLTSSAFSDRSGSTVDFVGAGHMFDPNSLYTNSTLYSLWVSYAELYNERVYDLLDNFAIEKNRRRKELKLMQDRNGFVYVKDLTELPVTSDEEAYKLFLAGRKNLQFAATQMNQHSSRSHSFFTIRVVSIGIEGTVPYPKTVHRMTFCDLAGMERANQTENRGFRLQESGNINNSLTVLLKVIRILREKQLSDKGHGAIETIPFRESKLTHIFKSYFTSSTHIRMIVNVNPDPIVADSTIQVLQNSAIASNVIVFRPIELASQLQQSAHFNGLNGKQPVMPNNCAKKAVQNGLGKRQLEDDSDTESDSDADDEYGAETVVAPKTMMQKLKVMEAENARLRQMLMIKETEITKLREDAVRTLVEERKQWKNRLQETRVVEENLSRRRISLMRHELSPGTRCGRCSHPTTEMEAIDETFEEDEEEDEEEEETDPGMDVGESDKEN